MAFEELGIRVPPPEKFKAFLVGEMDGCGNHFNHDIFHENLDQWEQYASYNVDYNHRDWPQRIARKNIDNYVVLAVSSDVLAGVDSYGFEGYFIIKRNEFDQIETNLQHLIWQKHNGIHEAIIWMLRQDFRGDKIYMNFFNPIEDNECEDDGMMRYITPKRTIPKDLFHRLPMKKFDWGNYEYSKRDYAGQEWMIILQSEFEPFDRFEERLKLVNETIMGGGMKQLHVENDGQGIKGSNFWDSDYACRGYFYLTFNQGAARLLIPDNRISDVEEMKTGKLVIISQGPWVQKKSRIMNEILFDDGTDNPYSIHFGMEQTDRKLPATDHGRDVPFSAWGRNAVKLFERPGKLRLNKRIPCLEAWKDVT